MLRPLCTANEIASSLSLPLPRVYQLARLGLIPVVRLGRSLRFDPDQVGEWLRNGGTGPWEAPKQQG